MPKPSTSIDKISYEQALAELEEIIKKLDNQPLELDTTLKQFERGKALIQRCQTLLDQAELKVRELSAPAKTKPVDE
jgi:exodeoxyribonuclease VII small subunit